MLKQKKLNRDIEEIIEYSLDLLIERVINIQYIFEEYKNLIKELQKIKSINNRNIPGTFLNVINELDDNSDNNELIKILEYEINHNKNSYIKRMEEILETFCEKECICKSCGSELVYNFYNEYIGEYQGTPAYEDFFDEGYCPYGCLNI